MKKLVMTALAVMVLIAAASLAAPAAAPAAQQAPQAVNAGFEKLKTLVGTWETKDDNGKSTIVSYRLVSGGSVLMEEVGEHAMVTMYHPDGDSVMMTHYCESKNQPRMRAAGLSKDGSKLNFKFVDVTNAAASTQGVMNHLKITFVDADHFTEEWTNSKDGVDTPWTFSLARKK